MARRFAAAHIKRFYVQGDRSRDQEEEEEEGKLGPVVKQGPAELQDWCWDPELGPGQRKGLEETAAGLEPGQGKAVDPAHAEVQEVVKGPDPEQDPRPFEEMRADQPDDGRAGSELSDPKLEERSTGALEPNLLGPLSGCLEEPRPGRRIGHISGAFRSWDPELPPESNEGTGGWKPSASKTPGSEKGEERGDQGRAPIAGNVVAGSGSCMGALDVVVEAPLTAKPDHWRLLGVKTGELLTAGVEESVWRKWEEKRSYKRLWAGCAKMGPVWDQS
ncbi:hypothetical protein BY996DRAFT_6503043 [Phakopsora pachyrhizi]|nr:hypothetical protein BY996DRAFT_6503043 [Phakopsora pachyrhizi]